MGLRGMKYYKFHQVTIKTEGCVVFSVHLSGITASANTCRYLFDKVKSAPLPRPFEGYVSGGRSPWESLAATATQVAN